MLDESGGIALLMKLSFDALQAPPRLYILAQASIFVRPHPKHQLVRECILEHLELVFELLQMSKAYRIPAVNGAKTEWRLLVERIRKLV